MIKSLTVSMAMLALVAPALAQDGIRIVAVQFARGASSAAMKGSIKGDEAVDYTVRVRAGQTLTVRLTTGNRSGYFNVTAPGADVAIFNGSISGKRFSVTIPSTGTYVVRVYLMRNAARRNDTANYTLNVAIL
ncbi:PPC domain-containing protein [Sphingobium boeckii]|uniref:Peptidase C-terminal archaeal/bacterial domain-containing protein n=1 Tax=Sphingobium boeckii TaxID=1082345 RepID=A0A7W9AG75_9SPHN|nr:PPC domain-containing protein [Sphingobium boeckii]MBB5684911.1 hypothetical protein [Sphingobium boeckii]